MTRADSKTDEQRAVVEHAGGHAKVSAVAGSGKTTTMVHRIEYLLSGGVDPNRILVVMFNRSARDEFESRLKRACVGRSTVPDVRTFHSLGKVIAERFEARGLLPAARLVTEDGAVVRLLREAVRAGGDASCAKVDVYDPRTLDEFSRFVDLSKSTLVPPREVFEAELFAPEFKFFVEAFERFDQARREAKLRTFADLIYDPCLVMQRAPDTVRVITDKFDVIIVDEYQDVSAVQEQLLVWVAGKRARVMVVGDVSQCIYKWRGARPYYITHGFDHDFPGATPYTLSRTFRFGDRLALLANHGIAENKQRDDKLTVSAVGTPDTRVHLRREDQGIGSTLDEWLKQGRKLSEVVVLVRLFSASARIELELLRRGTPYRVEGADSLLEQPLTRALCAYLELAGGGSVAWTVERRADNFQRILTYPPIGVSQDSARRIAEQLAQRPDWASHDLVRAGGTLAKWQQRLFGERAHALDIYGRMRADEPSAPAIADFGFASGLFEYLEKSINPEAVDDARALLLELRRLAEREQLTIAQFVGRLDEMRAAYRDLSSRGDGVLVTSIHRSKGLEWPVVVVAGLTDGKFPYVAPPARPRPDDFLEDERRLFYVAVTRAQEHLYLLAPDDPTAARALARGQRQQPLSEISRFVFEASPALSERVGGLLRGEPDALVEAEDVSVVNRYLELVGDSRRATLLPPARPRMPTSAGQGRHVLSDFETGECVVGGYSFRAGLSVSHPKLGNGKIIGFDGDSDRIVVRFDRQGQRTLVTSVAVEAGMRPA